MVGQSISHYRIVEKLGEGGMGVVYKAEDTKLERTVALKFLAAHLFNDGEAKVRFLREAKAAALSHANICTVYEIDDRHWYIAMELVDGGNVAQRIKPDDGPARPLPLEEALDLAIQTAAGLQEAHEHGVVHRDVKSANILVTRKGTVKITDFGLAQLAERSRLTKSGTSMGTPAFMSPEQAQNLSTDHRTDIWSLGVMLYEMLTGRLPFEGDYEQAVVYSIIHEDPPPVTSLRAGLPMDLERILGKALAKDPAERYQHADDLKVDLETVRRAVEALRQRGRASAAPASGSPPGAGVSASSPEAAPQELRSRPGAFRNTALFATAAIAIAVLAFFSARLFQTAPVPSAPRTIKFTIRPTDLRRGGTSNIDAEVSISHNGRHIAYVESENGQLWIRDIDQESARLVPGATHVYQTFWSPDDKLIGYAVNRDLMRIPLEGGTPALITKMAGAFRRASWSPDGEAIVYCDSSGMYTVPAKGGTPTRIIEHNHVEHPSFLELPNGRLAYLFQGMDNAPNHAIWVQRAGEEQRELIAVSSSTNPYPVYSETGHILYVDGTGQSTAIWALPFSPATLKPTGVAFPVAQRASSPSLSREGTLVYSDVPPEELNLIWCDRTGKKLSTIGEPAVLNMPALSPDGRYLASLIRLEKGVNIWIHDLERQIKTRFTMGEVAHCCVEWSPSGEEITFASNPQGNFDIFSKPSNGRGETKLLAGTQLREGSPTWSPVGRFLMYQVMSPETNADLLYRERKSSGQMGEPTPFLATPSREMAPRFSPDGRYVAYISDESGREEIYVRSFPGGEKQWQISTNGGAAPRWRRDGREIFYVEPWHRLMAVGISNPNGFSPGAPQALFENTGLFQGGYDATADGQRFVVRERLTQKEPLAIHIVHNWFEEFRDSGQQKQP